MIGVKLDEAHTRSLLDDCLITEAELAMGPDAWAGWPDPFPRWALAATE